MSSRDLNLPDFNPSKKYHQQQHRQTDRDGPSSTKNKQRVNVNERIKERQVLISVCVCFSIFFVSDSFLPYPYISTMNISTSTSGIRRRTAKSSQEVEENATTLNLGTEFALEQITHSGETSQLMALNLSEARILIREALKERKRIMRPDGSFIDLENGEVPLNTNDDDDLETEVKDDDNEELTKVVLASGANEVLSKTLTYLSQFSRFRDAETCSAVEQLLKSTSSGAAGELQKLHPFEVAQLGSLALDDVDEAKSLIPSLAGSSNGLQHGEKISEDVLAGVLNQLQRLETPY